MKETISYEIPDLYLEHSQHLVYDSQCSECYKQAPEVELSEDGYIQLVNNELRPPLTREDEEQLTLDKRMEEAEQMIIDDDSEALKIYNDFED